MTKLVWFIIIAFAFLLGFWISSATWLPSMEEKREEQATSILEKIEQVTKLVTVDGYFSEVYDYKDYYGYDWKIFRKKALIRIKAKVSVGYDMQNLDIAVDQQAKILRISKLPIAEILSIDHDLDYYDLTEGTFNAFTREDLNRLNDQAKLFIKNAALKSSVVDQATKRGEEMIDLLRFMVEGSGWKLVVEPSKPESGVDKK